MPRTLPVCRPSLSVQGNQIAMRAQPDIQFQCKPISCKRKCSYSAYPSHPSHSQRRSVRPCLAAHSPAHITLIFICASSLRSRHLPCNHDPDHPDLPVEIALPLLQITKAWLEHHAPRGRYLWISNLRINASQNRKASSRGVPVSCLPSTISHGAANRDAWEARLWAVQLHRDRGTAGGGASFLTANQSIDTGIRLYRHGPKDQPIDTPRQM
jgi:hypothetical protein